MKIKNTQKGAIMIVMVLFLIIISSAMLIGISYPVSNQVKGTSEYLKSKETFDIADSQIENSLYRFNKGKNDAPTDIYLMGATATAELVEIGGDKSVTVKGSKNIFERYIQSVFTKGEGTSFNYGLQVGSGGLYMDGSAKVIGNIYANGDIVGLSGTQWSQQNEITGTAIAATLSNPVESISIYNNSAGTTFDIGRTNSNQDIAQSFVAATTTSINEIQIYIKKTGLPANATVKIVNNDNGNPGSTVLTSGTLISTLTTNSFAYVPVVMNTSVNLVNGNTYWIVIDVSSNDNNDYYSLRVYDNQFPDFVSKQGRFVNNLIDTTPNTLDFDMKILVGGDKGIISGIKATEAWANVVNNSTVSGTIYCQIGSGNNKSCNTSKSDPVTAPYPVSDANISEWKSWAESGGATSTVNIDSSDTVYLGPMRINGDLNISQSGKLYITGPIYVTGMVSVTGSGKIFVDPSLDSASGLIISEGLINIGGSGGIYGSGQPGSYVLLNSMRSCTDYTNCNNNPAISISGSAGSVVLNTPNGAIKLSGSAKIKAGSSKMLIMDGSTSVEYETGLTNINFTTGPSGSWIKKLWSEVLGL